MSGEENNPIPPNLVLSRENIWSVELMSVGRTKKMSIMMSIVKSCALPSPPPRCRLSSGCVARRVDEPSVSLLPLYAHIAALAAKGGPAKVELCRATVCPRLRSKLPHDLEVKGRKCC